MMDVPNLPPYTTYNIWVSAMTAAGAGPEQSAALMLTTPQAACQRMNAPSTALIDPATGLYAVTWVPPTHPTGFIVRSAPRRACQHAHTPRSYQLQLNSKITVFRSSNVSVQSATLHFARPRTDDVRVRCVTGAGAGPWSVAASLSHDPLNTHAPSTTTQAAAVGSSIARGDLVAVIVPTGLLIVVIVLTIASLKRRKPRRPSELEFFLPGPDQWDIPRQTLVQLKPQFIEANCAVFHATARALPSAGGTAEVVVKVCHQHISDEEKRAFLLEAEFLKQFVNEQHPNIIRILGTCLLDEPLTIVLELLPLGDLHTYLNTHPALEWRTKLGFAENIASALVFMSARNVVHRDLACRNCMLASNLTVKLGNFGHARDLRQFQVWLAVCDGNRLITLQYYRMGRDLPLPTRWMAPECLVTGVFTTSSDMWSFGVTLWEIAADGALPYSQDSNTAAMARVAGGHRLEQPRDCPAALYRAMFACWTDDRPHCEQLQAQLLDWLVQPDSFDLRQDDGLPAPTLHLGHTHVSATTGYARIDRRTLLSNTHPMEVAEPPAEPVYARVRLSQPDCPHAAPYTRVQLDSLALRPAPAPPADTVDESATPIKRSSTVGSAAIAVPAGAEDRWRAHSMEQAETPRIAGRDVHFARAAVLAQRRQRGNTVSAYAKVTRSTPHSSIQTTPSFFALPVAGGRMESEPDLVLSSHTLARRESDV